jgi:hypothetical protein
MFTTGTSNIDRMIIAHSPSFPNYGLQYSDATDVFNFTNGSSSALTVDLTNLRVGVLNSAPGYTLDVNGNFNTSGFRMNIGSSLQGKVLTSNSTGDGTWQLPLSPSKFGSLTSVYACNNTSNYSYTPVVLTVTPTQNGVLNLTCQFDYNFNLSIASLADFGLYIATNTATPPNSSTPFVTNNVAAGFAAPPTGGAFGDIPVTILYSMNVTVGNTYYVYVGFLDGGNSAQTGANMVAPKIIATLNQSAGL